MTRNTFKSKLVPLLVGAIQEQNVLITNLTSTIASLTSRIEALEGAN